MKPFSPVQKLEFPVNPADKDRLIGWLSEHAWTAEEAILVLFGWDPHVEMRIEKRLDATLADSLNWRHYEDSRTIEQDFARARADLSRFIKGSENTPGRWLEIACMEFDYKPVWADYVLRNSLLLDQCPEPVVRALLSLTEASNEDRNSRRSSDYKHINPVDGNQMAPEKSIQQLGGEAGNRVRLARRVEEEVMLLCRGQKYVEFSAKDWDHFWDLVQDEHYCSEEGHNGSEKYCPKKHKALKLKSHRALRRYATRAFEECRQMYSSSTVQELRMQT